jgi:3-hydroxyisobutyrate dehydrogenase-like beta-hydroxyacid dehydrogenase
MTQPVLGFVGLGLMGQGFTKCLTRAGFRVTGFDLDPAKREAAQSWGVEPAASIVDLSRRADIVQICVMHTHEVEAVLFGPDGIAAAGRQPGKIVIDHSTTRIDAEQAFAARLSAETGMALVDAPISGGPTLAESGGLAIMAGGDTATIAQVRPVMEQLGTFTHVGPLGSGQAMKLVNQVMVLNGFALIAEAVRLAQAYDVDPMKIPEALMNGFAGSKLLPLAVERMAKEDFAPRGYARQCLKDFELMQEAARAKSLAMPMSATATQLFRALCAGGMSEMDATSVVTLIPRPKTA